VKRSRCFAALLELSTVSFLLGACGPAHAAAAETAEADALYAVAYQTFAAQATLDSARSPTLAPATPTPALPSATAPPPTLDPDCDNATLLADLTAPDGAVIAAGTIFIKTWLLKNSGTCEWSSGYKLAFVSGEQMQGADTNIGSPVPPGEKATVSVSLVAPPVPGTYKGIWRMQNADGQAFGDPPHVEVSVFACKQSSGRRVTISGHAGPEKVTIDYGLGTTFTDNHGNYSFGVPVGWSGTVTPSKAKVQPWTFDPPQRAYYNVMCDLNDEDYQATAPPGV
jgi:hypothetical protein